LETQKCPCCKRISVINFIEYMNLPEILFPVDPNVRNSIERYNLTLNYCSDCSHVFQKKVNKILNDRIYKELYKFYPFINMEAFNNTYRKPFDSMFNLFFPDTVSDLKLLEIGCNSIEMMKDFYKQGFKCTGVDPSGTSIEGTEASLIGQTYENIKFKEKFDVVIARFVLEHIIDLDVFMEKLSNDLSKNGVVFIQIPSTLNFIRGGTLCIGAHEHIHYFSKQSLSILFNRYGFSDSAIFEWNSPSILGCFYKTTTNSDLSIYSDFAKKVTSASTYMMELIEPYNSICLYGSGLQLMWLIYHSGIDFSSKKITIIDDNKILHGRFLPNTNYKICKPSEEIINNSDIIILTLSSIYKQKIIKKINNFGFNNKRIISFKKDRWIFLNNNHS